MTVLDFDPPQPTLRLVSTNGELQGRDTRYRAGAPLFGAARDLYSHVLQSALEHGTSINADALRVVLAAKQSTTPGPAHVFSAADIWQLMFVDVLAWCSNRKLEVPVGCAQALTLLVDHLDTNGMLDQLSDSAHDLHEAIDECTGGWAIDHPTAPRPDRYDPSPTKPRRSLRSERGPKRT